jgi:biofilm protein TabA
MIVDKIENAPLYFGLGDKFGQAFQYLQSLEYIGLVPGKYEISGESVYVLIQDYMTGGKKDRLEAHRRYVDIHFIVKGIESIGIANVNDLEAGVYDDQTHYVPMMGALDFVSLREGSFMVLYPQDAHMPGVAINTPQPIKKVVIKVLLK